MPLFDELFGLSLKTQNKFKMTVKNEPIKKRNWYSVEEYFELCEQSTEKLEYYNGKIVPMPGGTGNHNAIAANIIGEFKALLRNKEKKYIVSTSDQQIHIPKTGSYVYPDAVVIYEKAEYLEDQPNTLVNPLLVVEVASDSTRAYDMGGKFFNYKSITSLKEYLFVEQTLPFVSSFYRIAETTWEDRTADQLNQKIYLPSLDIEVALDRIYENIDFVRGKEDEKEDEKA